MIVIVFALSLTISVLKIDMLIEFFVKRESSLNYKLLWCQWMLLGAVVSFLVIISLTLSVKIVSNLLANRTHDEVGHMIILLMILQ